MYNDLIQNSLHMPTENDIINYMNDETSDDYIKLTEFLRNDYNATPVIMFSKCTDMPGWNVKYKKGSKSFCTIYPDKEYLTILLTIKEKDINDLLFNKTNFTKYFLDVLEKSGSLNGFKWLMIRIIDEDIIDDIIKIIKFKHNSSKKDKVI